MGQHVLCRYCNSFYDTDDNRPTSCSFHPKLPVDLGNTGPHGDYAELWNFPCCGATVKADIVEGRDVKPSQVPGCITRQHIRERGWRVFISYARTDEQVAKVLESELRRRGHRAWRDRSEILGGTEWENSIDRAIADADFFVLLLTPRAAASAQVDRELKIAFDSGKYVLPILLENCKIPTRIQQINCLDWRSERVDFNFVSSEGFAQLRAAVVFGPASDIWRGIEDRESNTRADHQAAAQSASTVEHQVMVVKDADGDTIGTLPLRKRYTWSPGHLLAIDGVIHVVAEVLEYSPSAVEVRVTRPKLSLDDAE